MGRLPGSSLVRVDPRSANEPGRAVLSNGIVVLSGPPCSGKSTVAQAWAIEESTTGRRRRHLEVDRLFDLLFPNSDRNRDDRLRAYDAAHLLARMFLDGGETVVLECTYARRDQRASLVEALTGSPVPLWVVEFFVTADEAVARFRTRSQVTDLDDGLVGERVAGFPYSDAALRLFSSEGTPEDQARNIEAWLQASPPSVDPESWAEAGRGWS
jgi:predicted kinase